ncbi:MAG TPA: glycosyltransferase family 2 protein [Symbiobacteriaceae bacterium]|nr:glycosyltransferase family 2 protein [Symbiobacteriaceae bacterium]
MWFARLAHWFEWPILVFSLLSNGLYGVMWFLAAAELLRHLLRLRHVTPYQLHRSAFTPSIALLMPAFNEQASIVESVKSATLLRYPVLEIIVINDGSKDQTLERVRSAYQLEPVQRAPLQGVEHEPIRGLYRSGVLPQLYVIDKVNGGKADSLNAGIAYCRSQLVCAVDADSLLQADSLERLVQPFIAEPERMAAVGGKIGVVNGAQVRAGQVVQLGLPRRLLPLFQVVEYLRSYYIGRLGWNVIGGLLIISGAFGLFRTDLIAAVGGYKRGSLGEDMELTVRLHRYLSDEGRPYKIAFVPDAVCWTEVPETLRMLWRQRSRWHRGLVESLWEHRSMLGDRRYGTSGLFAMPGFWVVEVLGPVVELVGWLTLPLFFIAGRLSLEAMVVFLEMAVLFGMILSVSAVLGEQVLLGRYRRGREFVVLVGVALLENLGYRQLTLVMRLWGIYLHLVRRGGDGWGEMVRKGFGGNGKSPT